MIEHVSCMTPISLVLVPIDFSARSSIAARYAAVIAKRFSARVALLHSLPIAHYAVGMETMGDAFPERKVDAAQQLEAFDAAELPNVPTDRLLVAGDPALAITDFARREPPP